jgi:hypothetical protein
MYIWPKNPYFTKKKLPGGGVLVLYEFVAILQGVNHERQDLVVVRQG